MRTSTDTTEKIKADWLEAERALDDANAFNVADLYQAVLVARQAAMNAGIDVWGDAA